MEPRKLWLVGNVLGKTLSLRAAKTQPRAHTPPECGAFLRVAALADLHLAIDAVEEVIGVEAKTKAPSRAESARKAATKGRP